MNYVLICMFVVLVLVSGVPLNPENIVTDENGNVYYNYLVPLRRMRRSPQDPGSSYIKAGGAWSSRYGGGGEIVANKNLAYGDHHSVDAQAKYSQFGRHKQGWAGINYSWRW